MPKIWQEMKKSLVQLSLNNPFFHSTSIVSNVGFLEYPGRFCPGKFTRVNLPGYSKKPEKKTGLGYTRSFTISCTSSSPSEKTIYGTRTTNPSQNNLLGVHRCTHSSSFHYTAKNRKRQKIDQKQNIFYPQFAESSRGGPGYLII